ncbi:hypothetical protein ASD80_10380 [Devosia sp. Root635]|nr:hypothetical protein ASD80_10380 [Devosia sp. Root635]
MALLVGLFAAAGISVWNRRFLGPLFLNVMLLAATGYSFLVVAAAVLIFRSSLADIISEYGQGPFAWLLLFGGMSSLLSLLGYIARNRTKGGH